jgi:hypothetical protein
MLFAKHTKWGAISEGANQEISNCDTTKSGRGWQGSGEAD